MDTNPQSTEFFNMSDNNSIFIDGINYCWNEEINKYTWCDTKPDLYSVATGKIMLVLGWS